MYEASPWAIAIFVGFVAFVLWISYFFAKKTKSAEGYFAAGGQIHWFINGIAFAGDYLSAASFLGICGMIAVYGYDGFLYSIGYLAGWIVALFVVAEPMKRLGKFTFTDALDSKFNSKGIQLTAAISTLVVSMFYLIPQMVGAGVLVTPLLGLPHWIGVVGVGAIVIFIVATAGMASTTYVQFLKGALLIIFSIVVVAVTLNQGLKADPGQAQAITITVAEDGEITLPADSPYAIKQTLDAGKGVTLVELADKTDPAKISWWRQMDNWGEEGNTILARAHWETKLTTPVKDAKGNDSKVLFDGIPRRDLVAKEDGRMPMQDGYIAKLVIDGKEVDESGPLGLTGFLGGIKDSNIISFPKSHTLKTDAGVTKIYYPVLKSGSEMLTPGQKFKVDAAKGATAMDKLNFASLMLALFCGTASLPHILIRYYTVPSPACARKSTIVAISSIGLFYVLTMFLGLGAMVYGVVDVTDGNMSAPLLAKTFGITLFAVISAIAFATVLGTVSGLIVAASGAVAHDLMDRFMGMKLTDKSKVRAGKISAIVVGIFAIILGIMFKGMNVSYLVGWAFAVAASANLPAIVMLLFWKKTTKRGIAVSIMVGMISAVGLILLSPDMFARYGMSKDAAPIALSNPGIISIPLSFLTLVLVSLMTEPTEPVAAIK